MKKKLNYIEIANRINQEISCSDFLTPDPHPNSTRFICPFCGSGTHHGRNSTGDVAYYSDKGKNYCVCYACHKIFNPIALIAKFNGLQVETGKTTASGNDWQIVKGFDFIKAVEIGMHAVGISEDDIDKSYQPRKSKKDENEERFQKMLDNLHDEEKEKENFEKNYKSCKTPDEKESYLNLSEQYYKSKGKLDDDYYLPVEAADVQNNAIETKTDKNTLQLEPAFISTSTTPTEDNKQRYNDFLNRIVGVESNGQIVKPDLKDFVIGEKDPTYQKLLSKYNAAIERKKKDYTFEKFLALETCKSDFVSYYSPARDLEKNKFWDGISTGFKSLDKIIGGNIHPGITVIAGATGAGKTTFALNLAHNLIYQNKGIIPIFISYEIPKLKVLEKSIALHNVYYYTKSKTESAKDEADYLTNRISEKRFIGDSRSYRTALEIEKELDNEIGGNIDHSKGGFHEIYESYMQDVAPYLIINDRDFKVEEFEKAIECYKTIKKLEGTPDPRPVLFIDYLQFMRLDASNAYSRKDEVDRISKELVELSKRLNLPIFLLSSVNRESYKDGKKIQITGLKESGEIEFDAEAVYILNSRTENNKISDNYKLTGSENGPKKCYRQLELDVEKNRSGIVGANIKLDYFAALDYFVEPDDTIKPEEKTDKGQVPETKESSLKRPTGKTHKVR